MLIYSISLTSVMGYKLYYIGSSVCTSLVEGESMLHPKGMGLLEIKLKKFRLLSIPFTQIRPFIYGDFSLKDVKGMTLNEGLCMCMSILNIVH
jgi:hypothetical protein